MSGAAVLDINTLALVVMALAIFPVAVLSDRFGRKPLLVVAGVAALILAWSFWWLVLRDAPGPIFLGQLGFALISIVTLSIGPATMAEMLPAEVRVRGTSIAYSIAAGVLGGTTPLVATWLVATTGNEFAPVVYYMATTIPVLVAVLTMTETAGKPLR